ncbi:nitrite reductase small subunit NirD [Alkalimarinus alittae]|uniref:Nitrite reductase small subunit NirD n=1 Tax=Alkalimarinus alittae TaxID=2961619 RepID=A0ABY6N093_9ALTE|nr:nitrite reductase small subunit NirD [Alkalimarinus alittae]UZE95499.1 nitrite reductase small subunit NirD [Alkalimarinus alittae]
MSQTIEIGKLTDIPKLGSRVVKTKQGDIAVFRTMDDEVFALHDSCPHKQGALSQGIVHGKSVTCPLHNWVIGLDDGEAKGHDKGCTKTFEARLEGGMVYLFLEDVIAA